VLNYLELCLMCSTKRCKCRRVEVDDINILGSSLVYISCWVMVIVNIASKIGRMDVRRGVAYVNS
jgi:hypothetical protein